MMRSVVFTLAGAGVVLAASACARGTNPGAQPSADSVQVGYGAQPKDKLTGAVTTLSPDDVTGRPLAIEQMLRGRIPGLVITGAGPSLQLRLRGNNSNVPEQEPLVVVDDVMIPSGSIGSALAGLTPDDIRQVSVLKDIASTSIYGTRGAGGVILIKTKAKPDGAR